MKVATTVFSNSKELPFKEIKIGDIVLKDIAKHL